jgi:signal transduction histidine kinase
MINSVLEFASLRAGTQVYHLTELDLRATVSTLLKQYRSQFEERGAQLDVCLQEDLPPVAHDAGGITQILLNLLDNAIKYGLGAGCIQVRLEGDQDWVDIEVIDFGPGIPEDELPRLHRAFQRGLTVAPRCGSGLGLALVEQIALAHNAHFIVASPEGHTGVKAVVSFPSYRRSS